MALEWIASLLEVLTLLSGLVFIVLVAEFVWKGFSGKELSEVWRFLRKHFLILAFVVALVSTLGSLYYSDVRGFAPCVLCWWQRIFMYSQVVLFGVALAGRDRRVATYGLSFSVVGAVIALGHYLSQLGIVETACDVVGYSVSCSEHFGVAYGYITIPVMALTGFVLIGGLCVLGLLGSKN